MQQCNLEGKAEHPAGALLLGLKQMCEAMKMDFMQHCSLSLAHI